MKKRYIVCINSSTKEQDQKFLTYLRDNGFGWWHHLKNTWLIVDLDGTSKINDIRDVTRESYDKEYTMVFQLNEGEGTWSGYGPSSDNKNMFKWIRENW